MNKCATLLPRRARETSTNYSALATPGKLSNRRKPHTICPWFTKRGGGRESDSPPPLSRSWKFRLAVTIRPAAAETSAASRLNSFKAQQRRAFRYVGTLLRPRPPHTFRAILSAAAIWLCNAAFCDNCGAREFPLIPHASASSDSLAAYSLARLALTPLAMFGRARLLQAVEESQFVVIPSEARDLLFAKCQGKSRFLTPQTPFGMTKREFFRSLLCSCRKR